MTQSISKRAEEKYPISDTDTTEYKVRMIEKRKGWVSGYTAGLKAADKAVNPNDIIKYFDEKGKRIIDEFGWTGHYNVTAKDILDFLIDVVQ